MMHYRWEKLQRNIEKMSDDDLQFFLEGLAFVDRPEYKIAIRMIEAEIMKRDRQE